MFHSRLDVCDSIPLNSRRSLTNSSNLHRLQELIAPSTVYFRDGIGNYLGSKAELANVLSEITGINLDVLRNNDQLSSKSVAVRFSWAARRKTSRKEDEAYALLGIFDVISLEV